MIDSTRLEQDVNVFQLTVLAELLDDAVLHSELED